MKEYRLGFVLEIQNGLMNALFENMVKEHLPEIELVFDKRSESGFEYDAYTDVLDNLFLLGMAVSTIYNKIDRMK